MEKKNINRKLLENKLIQYYKMDKNYYEKLLNLKIENYKKYIDYLKPDNGKKVLDVGCGVGIVVHQLYREGFEAYGVDVSPIAIEIAQRQGTGIFKVYDGKNLPFPNEYFDSVGCKDVLEHTPYPERLLDEMIRVLKVGGKIVISAPNFLKVFGLHNYHPRMCGVLNKIKNLCLILKKIVNYYVLNKSVHFELMEPLMEMNNVLIPDSDAVCVTNPIDIGFYLKRKGLKIVYVSSCNIYHNNKIISILGDLPIIRSLTGAVFIVAKKVCSEGIQ